MGYSTQKVLGKLGSAQPARLSYRGSFCPREHLYGGPFCPWYLFRGASVREGLRFHGLMSATRSRLDAPEQFGPSLVGYRLSTEPPMACSCTSHSRIIRHSSTNSSKNATADVFYVPTLDLCRISDKVDHRIVYCHFGLNEMTEVRPRFPTHAAASG